ncbi:hypothetical protein DFQ26_009080 [Actinomortierella ambigua]|nr:hypothetical protein DFQ26_009080 [Actinomortierella ambigua]
MTVADIYSTVPKPTPRTQTVDIGDGLIMRWSTKDDLEDIEEFLAEAFRWIALGRSFEDVETPAPNQIAARIGARAVRGDHIVASEYDYAIVVDTRATVHGSNKRSKVVAGLYLQHHSGYFGDVELKIGGVEAVGTLEEYRSKGLIRKLMMELMLPTLDAEGHLIQIIGGIPHFYSAFGFEYALRFRDSATIKDLNAIPPRPKVGEKQEEEPFTLRPPTRQDIPYMARLAHHTQLPGQPQIGLEYNDKYWEWTAFTSLEQASSYYDSGRLTRIIVDATTGKDVGVVVLGILATPSLEVFALEEGASYRDAVFPVLRQVLDLARERFDKPLEEATEAAKKATTDEERANLLLVEYKLPRISSLSLQFPECHPVRQLTRSIAPGNPNCYRLYTRIPSYADLIMKTRPVLEQRLAKSAMAGLTARVQLDFYCRAEGQEGRGLEIVLERGQIIAAHPWKPLSLKEKHDKARAEKAAKVKPATIFSAGFVPLSFTRLVVGDSDLDELQRAYPATMAFGDEAKILLEILFPKVNHQFDGLYV